MLTIEIPLPTPSLNVLQRMHYHARRRLLNQYVSILRTKATKVTRCKPYQFRHVTITRHGARLLDVDNLVGGCKPLVDALERSELIWRDSPKYLRVTYEQLRTSASRTKTIIVINVL